MQDKIEKSFLWGIFKVCSAVFASVLFCLVTLEWTFPYWFPRLVPAQLVMTLPDVAVRPLLQTSKDSFIPDRYIALLGDSYAEGAGDWAESVFSLPAARYHSAHLLHEATGIDVISFGASGAGSVRGIVTRPVGLLAYMRHYLAPEMPDPEVAVIYFYEGNDLNENVNYFSSSFPFLFSIEQQFSSEVYQQYLQQFAVEKNISYYLALNDRWLRHFPFLHFVTAQTALLLGLPQEKTVVPGAAKDLGKTWVPPVVRPALPGTVNRASMNGAVIMLPDKLQGPPMELSALEEQQAWFAFEQSVIFIQRVMPRTQFVLVYVPSVLLCYDLQGEWVSRQPYDRPLGDYNRSGLQAKHAEMLERFSRIGTENGMLVIDTTPHLQQAARRAPLHGPNDWNHFNRRGYEAFSEAIYSALAPALAAPVAR